MAINNGCDVNCGNTYLHILGAVQDGLVTEETITEAAVRLFTTRYLLGLIDGSEFDQIPYTEVESAEHLALARRAARRLLRFAENNGILPLDKAKLKISASLNRMQTAGCACRKLPVLHLGM
ncbi:MAG: hypothetical protein ACLU3N_08895 [Lachnospiraceae bacterium]